MKTLPSATRGVALACGWLVVAGTSIAQIDYPLKLSVDSQVVYGDVQDFVVSPDGSRIAYLADQETDEMRELYTVPVGGGTAVKLSGGASIGAFQPVDFEFSPDGSRVIYRQHQGSDSGSELFSVDAGGGEPVRLNQSLSSQQYVSDFQISPDSGRVVYRVKASGGVSTELFSVAITGGEPVVLNGPLPAGGDVLDYAVTADSSRVVYRADQESLGVRELFSVLIEGGGPVKLNKPLDPDGDVTAFRVSPDGSRVAYCADQETDNAFELFSVPVGGGSVDKLNGSLVAGGDVTTSFEISPDGSRVAYIADQEAENVEELYSVPIGGGTVVKLNLPLPTGSDVDGFAFTPDSARVVYRADQNAIAVAELYSVPAGGGTPVRLNGPLVAGGDVADFRISPDGGWVAYRADEETDNVLELFGAPVTGGTVKRLNGTLVAGGDVGVGYEFTPDSSRVIYLADQETDDISELYSVPAASGSGVKLNGPLADGGEVAWPGALTPFLVLPGKGGIVYIADELTNNVVELFRVEATGGTPAKLNPPLAPGSGLGFAEFSPDGERVVYLSAPLEQGQSELYSVGMEGSLPSALTKVTSDGGSVAGFIVAPDGERVIYKARTSSGTSGVLDLYSLGIDGGTPVKLNPELVAGGVLDRFVVSADSSRVVYLADQDVDDRQELYSVPVGGGPVVRLNGDLAAGGNVWNFALSPDGTRVVYLADHQTDDMFELFSVPIGGGTAVKLNGPLSPGGSVGYYFTISREGGRVVYVADEDRAGVPELYSASITGGGRVKLNGSLVAGGEFSTYDSPRISPDGLWVVYGADQDTDEVVELYSVSILGGTTTRLNPPLGGDQDVGLFTISPDGSRVVYRCNLDDDGVDELFSVPITGGGSVKLNGSLADGRAVYNFGFASPPNRVVYAVARRNSYGNPEIEELWSVPADGGAAVRISGALTPDGRLDSNWKISPDGETVAYSANMGGEGSLWQVYRTPVTGGPPVRVNGPLVAGGNAFLRGFSPDGSRILYTADQETDGVSGLYVWAARCRWASGGGSWDEPANWDAGVAPDRHAEALVGVPAVVTVTPASSPAEARVLWLGGGDGLSVLELTDGAALSLADGGGILAGGVLAGNGTLALGGGSLGLAAGGELWTGAGEHLLVVDGAVSNAGLVEAVGNGAAAAQVGFGGGVTNLAGSGAIIGHDAILRFREGLVNRGSLSFGGGVNDVFGDLSNEASGRVTVSGGALAIFNDDVANAGAIQVSAAGPVAGTAVFFGSLSGNGVSGGGNVFVEGDARPGFSAGSMEFGGALSLGAIAVLELELGGSEPGSGYDRLVVAGHLALGGVLQVVRIDDFMPQPGMVFDLWDAGSASGGFGGIFLPELPAGSFWHSADLVTAGELRVGRTPETYSEFAAGYGLTTPPDGDQEGDGRSNLFEYLSGDDPTVADFAAPLLAYLRVGDEDRLSFNVASPPGADLVIELETTNTLGADGPGGWSVLQTRTGSGSWTGSATGVSSTPGGAGRERVTIVNRSPDGIARFYRLRLRLAP